MVDDVQRELRDYTAALRRSWPVIVVVTMVVAGLVAAVLSGRSGSRLATAQLALRDDSGVLAAAELSGSAVGSPLTAQGEAQLLRSDAFKAAMAEKLGSSPEVTITGDDVARTITITTSSSNTDDAKGIIQAYVDSYLDLRHTTAVRASDAVAAALAAEQKALQQRIDELGAQLATLTDVRSPAVDSLQIERGTLLRKQADVDGKVAAVDQYRSSTSGGVQMVSAPTAAKPKTSVSKLAAIVLGLFLGLMIAVSLVLIRTYFDRTVRSARSVERATGGRPLLAAMPKGGEPAPTPGGTLPVGPAAMGAAGAVLHAARSRQSSALLVVGAGRSVDSAATVFRICTGMARLGRAVTLVDGEVEHGSLAGIAGVPAEPGLADTAGQTLAAVDVRRTVPGAPGLALVPAGRASSPDGDILASPEVAKLLDELKDSGDLVVVYGPPLGPAADAAALARLVDMTVVIIADGKTKEDDLAVAAQILRGVGSELAGIIVTDVPSSDLGRFVAVRHIDA